MDLENISTQNKEFLIKNVGKMYRDSTQLAINRNTTRVEESNGLYVCLEMKFKIETILNELRLEYALIIQKEFLENKENEWYLEYFTKEEYSMYKKGAIDSFLHCLYG